MSFCMLFVILMFSVNAFIMLEYLQLLIIIEFMNDKEYTDSYFLISPLNNIDLS